MCHTDAVTRSPRAPAIVLTTLAIALTLDSVAGQVTPDGRGDEGLATWLAESQARDDERLLTESGLTPHWELSTCAHSDAVVPVLPAGAPPRTQIFALASEPLARTLGAKGLLVLNV